MIQSFFAFPLTSVVTPAHLSLLPEQEFGALIVKVSLAASKPCAQQNRTSKDNPLWLLLFTPAKNEVIKEARTYLFSPGHTGEAQLSKYPVLLQSACSGVALQVAKSSAKCSDCHTLHPLPISQRRASQKDL